MSNAITEVQAVEIKEDAFDSVKRLVLARKAAGKKCSPSEGLVHAILMTKVMVGVKELLTEAQRADESVVEHAMFLTALELENGSALRQRLAKEKGFEFLKADKAVAIASDYADL